MSFWTFYRSRLLAALWASLSLSVLVALVSASLAGEQLLGALGFYAYFTFVYSAPVALVLAPPLAWLVRRLPASAKAAIYALVAGLMAQLIFGGVGGLFSLNGDTLFFTGFAAVGGLLFALFESRVDKTPPPLRGTSPERGGNE